MTDQTPAPPAARALPIKTIIVVLAMLLAEAGLIIGAVMLFGRPSSVHALHFDSGEALMGDRAREISLLHEKFTNNRRGRLWIYDLEVIILVKENHVETVTAQIDARRAQIRSGVNRIMTAAQASYFEEPGYETIRRQILEFLNGPSAESAIIPPASDGQPRVKDVLIPSCIGFPADY
ncbi:MAG: hypothetical protein EA380_06355 [Phycisphaeraceae bacterium]|nr:MAG: hypothetical protein EA380_06355 [Phycisphaeraceae bacterium]